jgi:hypothetical protein
MKLSERGTMVEHGVSLSCASGGDVDAPVWHGTGESFLAVPRCAVGFRRFRTPSRWLLTAGY